MFKVRINIDNEILSLAHEARLEGELRSENCPIALDLKRQGMARPRVSKGRSIFIDRKGVRREFQHSLEAQNFVITADVRGEISCRPQSFDLGDAA